eukprot:4296593-Alexandrium_andersonii.AAC.1
MSASLVGSEMCIRDSFRAVPCILLPGGYRPQDTPQDACLARAAGMVPTCLLYTSDAADDM